MSYKNPGRMGLLGAPTYPMLRDSTQAALLEVLESNRVPFDLNKAEHLLTMQDTGSRILLRSVDDFERLRGTNLAWFGLDELTYCPEEAWLRLEGRLRDPMAQCLEGFGVWTPKGYEWVFRRFVQSPTRGYFVVQAEPFENRHLLDKVPDFYERLESSYDEAFYQQEVLGQYLNAQNNLVYQSFDRSQHLRKLERDGNAPLLWTLDFNVDPMCSLVAQKRGETICVLDEIVLSRAGTADACERFLSRFGQPGISVVVYGDASGNRMQTTGRSDYDMIRRAFAEAGLRDVSYRVPARNPAVRERIQKVNAKLRNVRGDIDLLIDERCRELVKDLEQVTYMENSQQIDKDRDPRRTHLSDALGYLIWQEEQRTQCGEKGQRLV